MTRQAAFLAAYRKTASVLAAAKLAKIKPARHYQWVASDARYRQRFTELQEKISQLLQDRAFERALDGWREPLYRGGKVCGQKHRFSTRLLLLLLRAHLPEDWK